MEFNLLMKIRTAAVFAVGILILGFGGYSFIAPDTPMDAISLFSGNISGIDMAICAGLAFAAGAVAYFAAYPYGRQLGPLAAAAGLAFWTFRSGLMASLLRVYPTAELRRHLYMKNQVEAVLWLGVLAAGFLGTFAASKLTGLKEAKPPDPLAPKGKNEGINIAIAMVLSVVITYFCIAIFARDVRLFDSKLTSVIGQPGNRQIAFAVILSFGIAGFVAKKFFMVNYIYPATSAVLLVIWVVNSNATNPTLEHMKSFWPANFFPNSASAILPLQMICFAAIGSFTGYWIAIKVQYSHEMSQQEENQVPQEPVTAAN